VRQIAKVPGKTVGQKVVESGSAMQRVPQQRRELE